MFIRALKTYLKRRCLLIFITFFLLLLFNFNQSTNKKTVFQCLVPQSQVIDKNSPGFPVRLVIPAINVNSEIQYVGVSSKGEMEVPSNAFDAGWFKLGPKPGENGSSVIAGHFNGINGEAGVFYNLYKLKAGDRLYIKDDKGISITFIVKGSHTYDPGYANDVFSPSDSAHLNLITCDGLWNGVKKSYSKRLVVFTDAIQ